MTEHPFVRLALLESFEVSFAEEVLRISVPAQRLLAQLAVVQRGRPVERTTLAERLWPETPPPRAAASLRSVLWRLPRPRGRTLVTCTTTTVRLSEDVRVDLWDAEERARRLCGSDLPTPDALADLTPLTRDLLPGWHEDWIQVEQETFRQTRLHALERSAWGLRAQGHFSDALCAGLGAVRGEPLRESAHRSVIEVHLAEGNHAEALRQYHGYRRLLADELGLPPSPAIRRLMAPLLGRPVDLPTRGNHHPQSPLTATTIRSGDA
ncbi:bacterial transcriptional activator domain-containing protein [Nocardioides sp. cx-173]|uniref:AfsR/SARP family transcriptional regulator n=1 Tax=Nocardioides sp. cx-173 TaxID=2898796 RepID=UPI001E649D98|nr:bacterial transcriptional activator domain-containing protein [Nocardioides sp. cx-173]MCD4525004.1 bacterial transcriptional activator domain-containing protein [Nocardioides sp. cx-173]UGB40288.1 bacterial transcriptional activator domain-containing protein [Nocardioides sp. cx-173]